MVSLTRATAAGILAARAAAIGTGSPAAVVAMRMGADALLEVDRLTDLCEGQRVANEVLCARVAELERLTEFAGDSIKAEARAVREVEQERDAALARVVKLERELAEGRMLARFLAGQPCQCEQPALPVTGGPPCAPCDAASWLGQLPGQPKPDAAGQPPQTVVVDPDPLAVWPFLHRPTC